MDEAEDEAVRRTHQNLPDEIGGQIEDLEEEIEDHVEVDLKLSVDAHSWTRYRA
ncbi:hypothetical protein [Salinibacter ruber]|uniref:Uncharacterized protein n=1 Tax=Salinibacter ruber TaxID=146919 RepID=A0AAW5P9H5_9BACT|nr:hypothetical protein [Salinibacter ruber]MCS4157977.1 hypothetical protein [Salinibacter ruber]